MRKVLEITPTVIIDPIVCLKRAKYAVLPTDLLTPVEATDSTFVVKFVLVSNSALQQGCTGLLNHAQLCDDENPVWGHHCGLIVEDFRWSDNYCPQSWTLTEY